MSKVRHAPLPFDCGYVPIETHEFDVTVWHIASDEKIVARSLAKYDAEFIVTACNSHYQLQERVAELEAFCRRVGYEPIGDPTACAGTILETLTVEARALLDKEAP